ncbi:MAG: winged helix DNA-binding domain-containing protein [Eubacteriales bacterium]|nr:winged helix DNA-binding domain-containing protein [Eubacteriales bacterium]
MITLSNRQARQFVLLKQGLRGEHRYAGARGVLSFVRQAGCIQYDPVDICGKNAELTLQSRVTDFTKQTLYDLLYRDHSLVDYPDKNLSILPTEDWPYFACSRMTARENGLRFPELAALESQALQYIEENGAVSSAELPLPGSVRWHSVVHWSGNWEGETNAARAVLEQLYTTGDLVIYRRDGTRKVYDLSARHIPAEVLSAPDPLPDEHEHRKWRLLRRIGAAGLLWNRPSDAWLNIGGLSAQERATVFSELLADGKILELRVEDLKDALFFRSGDLPLIETVLRQGDALTPRCELLAPLDPMLWDRRLIRSLFGFTYTWELYTPPAKRKYGCYVLPVLYGDRFIGRAEAVADVRADTLTVKNLWYEDGVEHTGALCAALDDCLRRFAAFNGCAQIHFAQPDILR